VTDARIAAREAAAHGASAAEIAAALDRPVEDVAEWIAAESRGRDVDPWTLVQDLVHDARDQMRVAHAVGDAAAAKSLAGTLARLAPVLARLDESRSVDGLRVLPAEIAAAEGRVRALVAAAVGGSR